MGERLAVNYGKNVHALALHEGHVYPMNVANLKAPELCVMNPDSTHVGKRDG